MEKITLPIKTKVAAWWMIVIGTGTVFLTPLAYLSLAPAMTNHHSHFLDFIFAFIFVLFCSSFLLIIFSFFLLKKKGWAWIFLILLLISLNIFLTWLIIHDVKELQYVRNEVIRLIKESKLTTPEEIVESYQVEIRRVITAGIIFYFVCIPPLLLLLLDRKNF